MKKIIGVFFTLMVMAFACVNAVAQDKAKVAITSVKQRGETVRFAIMGSKPFIYANNRYVLHVGDKDFSRYEQGQRAGKGFLTFLVPAKDVKTVSDGAKIYLTYGDVDTDERDMEDFTKESIRCWSLGKYSRPMMHK